LQLKVTRKEVKEVVVQEDQVQGLKIGLHIEAQAMQEQRLSQEILLIQDRRQLHQEEVLTSTSKEVQQPLVSLL
jgi:hypothetical protein